MCVAPLAPSIGQLLDQQGVLGRHLGDRALGATSRPWGRLRSPEGPGLHSCQPAERRDE